MQRRIAFIGLLFLLLFSIAPRTTAQNNNERPLVATTTTIIADVARNIAGEHAEVISLMPPYADVHAFDPTPQELIQLSEADVVLINGADLEETMIDIVYNAAAVEPTVVSNGLTVLAYGIDRGAGNLGITPRRMLLGDDAGNVHVLNVFSDEIIATYALGEITSLHAEEGRHPRYGFVMTDEAVHVIDSGFRMVAHFDHYDPYLVSPRLMDFRLTDVLPGMLHVNGDLQVVASHESSQLTFFEDADISAEAPQVSTIPEVSTNKAWVWDERVVTPIRSTDGEQIGLQILDLTGNVLFTVEDCPMVAAGFVATSDSIAFDCTTHALTIETQDDNFVTQRTVYPEDATVNAMIYHPEQNLLVGVTASGILTVDLQTHTSSSIVGVDVVALVPHPNDDEAVLALTRTGELHSINVVTGETIQSIRIQDMPRETESQPLLMASGDMVYIGLADQELLVEVYASAEELVVTDKLELGFAVQSMVAFGAVVDPHALDTTSQVTGRVLGAGVDCRIQGDAVHGPCDPHFWLDPNNVMVWADNIAAALSEADPTNADAYVANAAAYKLELAALDAEIEALVAIVPLERRQLVTNHDFMGYFARRYGFEVVGVVLPGGSTLSEPSARELVELVEIIEDEGIESIIVEASNPNRISDRIATEVGIDTILLYSGALGDPDGEVGTYIDLMRFNANAIANTLGEQ